MASFFIQHGHQVTVLTEIPNHPSGIIHPSYRRKLIVRSNWGGIDIIRVWVKASPKKTFLNRMLFYMSYLVNAAIAGILIARGEYDLIYATSPPLSVGGTSLFIKWIRKIPMVFEVRDLWPDSAIHLGELNNSSAITLARKLESECYKHAARIVVVTQGTQALLLNKGIPAEKIVVIPNGANLNSYRFTQREREKIRIELQLQDKFIAIYAGIHGIAQGLENVIEAAKMLERKVSIHFLLVGSGPQKAMLTHMVKDNSLTNVIFHDEVPMDDIPSYLSAADVALVSLKNIELFNSVLPSKMFDAWACECPIILTVDGEARRVMEEAQAGVFVPPESPEQLAEKLKELVISPDDLQRMGKNGRKFVEKHYSREVLAEKLLVELENTLK